MKRFIVLVYFLPVLLFSQSGFNRSYSINGNISYFTGVANINNTLYIKGTYRDSETNKWNLGLLKLDSLGNIDTFVEKSHEWNFNTLRGKIMVTSDNSLFIHSDFSAGPKGFTFKLNQDLEEEFFRVLDDTINRVVLHREAIEISNGYIIGGDLQKQDYSERIWASRLDEQGNEVWYREYAPDDADPMMLIFVQDMARTREGNAIIAGAYAYPVPGEEYVYNAFPFLLIIDKETGEPLWERQYDTAGGENMNFSSIAPLSDGTYLAGDYIRVGPSGGAKFSKIVIRRLDANGDIIWEKIYDPVLKGGMLYEYVGFHPLPDGRYVLVSQRELADNYSPYDTIRVAITLAFDPEDGTESWMRLDTIPSDTINNQLNYVEGATVLSTGSIVVAGYNKDYPAKGWLLKMDKNGCIQDDCAITATVEIPREQPTAPVIYPNPAGDYLHLEGEVHSDLWIEDMQGRIRRIIPKAKTAAAIDIHSLPAGIYLLRGKTDGIPWVLKWVKI